MVANMCILFFCMMVANVCVLILFYFMMAANIFDLLYHAS